MRIVRILVHCVLWSGLAGGLAAQPAGPAIAAETAPTLQPKAAEFGTTSWTHVRIPWMEFRPFVSTSAGDWVNGPGITGYPTGTGTPWLAPVYIPGGALLKRVELDYCDTNSSNHISLTVLECDNEGQACVNVPATTVSSGNFGCASTATSTLNYRIDNYIKLYALNVSFGAADGTNSLAGAIVSYALDVSPAPATATFADVPTSDPGFQYIEALYASGITAGCSGGNYCPDAPLTRRQMAVFLAKALGLHWFDY